MPWGLSCCSASVTRHSPALQPVLHASPQPPQLASSVCSFTQLSPQVDPAQVQTPPLQSGVGCGHAVPAAHWPFAPQICTLSLEHCVAPGAQTPVQAPSTQAWFVQTAGLPHCPLELQVTTAFPSHCLAPGVHGPGAPSPESPSAGPSNAPPSPDVPGTSSSPSRAVHPTARAEEIATATSGCAGLMLQKLPRSIIPPPPGPTPGARSSPDDSCERCEGPDAVKKSRAPAATSAPPATN